jgi:hypothetical protein
MPRHSLNDGGTLTAARDLSQRFALSPGTYQVQAELVIETVSPDGTTHYYGSVLSNTVMIEIVPRRISAPNGGEQRRSGQL